LAKPAQARIVYTKTHQVINERTQGFVLDLDNDGQGDFFFGNYGNCTSQGKGCFDSLGLAIVGPDKRIEEQSSLVLALKKGAVVGPKAPFPRELAGLMAHVSWTSGGEIRNSAGEWINVKDHFVGMRFGIHGKTHYGWARLSVSFDLTNAIQATLIGYAYETIPNKPIIAGKTNGPDEVTVQPASLGHLATGASAIPAWRVKRTAATSH
jgi:hypothetical protein